MKRTSSALSPTADQNKRYAWEDNTTVQTNNRYSVLSQVESEESDDQGTQPTQPTHTTQQREKVPPIFMGKGNGLNYLLVHQDIKSNVENEFTTMITRDNCFKIQLSSIEDYRKLTKYYEDNNINIYSYQAKADKPLSVVMKLVPESLKDEEIAKELKLLNLPIISVTRLLFNKKPTTTCAILLTNTDAAKEIFKLEYILNAKIYIEIRRKSSHIPQCHNCQRFGHTKNYCRLESRCVKCNEKHQKNACQKTAQQKPMCVNCKGEHPASYRGCPYHLELLQQRNEQKFKQNTFKSSYRTAGKSFAQATNTTNSQQQQSNDIIDTILNWIKQTIMSLLPQIQTFITKNIVPNLFNAP